MRDQETLPVLRVAASLLVRRNAFEAMTADERRWVFDHPEEAIALLVDAVRNHDLTEVDPGQVVEVAGTDVFVLAEKFKQGISADNVVINWLGRTFLGLTFRKMEKNVAPATLRIQKFKKELFAKAKAVKFASVWEVVKAQGAGQQGNLLVDGGKTFVRVLDENGAPLILTIRWLTAYSGWEFTISPAGRVPRGAKASDLMISRC